MRVYCKDCVHYDSGKFFGIFNYFLNHYSPMEFYCTIKENKMVREEGCLASENFERKDTYLCSYVFLKDSPRLLNKNNDCKYFRQKE